MMNTTLIYRIFCILTTVWLVTTICLNYYIYLLLLLILRVSYFYIEKKYRELLPVNKKNVLITGCDTGKFIIL